MKLNVQFEENKHHAWLIGDDSLELFIHRPSGSLAAVKGQLTCWVPSEIAEEIRVDKVNKDEPDSIFICCAYEDRTDIFQVQEAVTFPGGDVLMFLLPSPTTIH